MRGDLEALVGRLRAVRSDPITRHGCPPSREALARVGDDLRAALFPEHFGPAGLGAGEVELFEARTLVAALGALEEQVRFALAFDGAEPDAKARNLRAAAAIEAFTERLPEILVRLHSDVRAAYEGDPAATSGDEALLSYAGVTAIIFHRIAHELYVLDVPLVPRLLSAVAHSRTGIDIHPGATIGASFFIDHGTGVVIGETCVIGDRVRLYQGVTLGAKSFPLDAAGHPVKGIPRHPIVEDDVVIYAGATVLGRITVGRGSQIGGNVWLTNSVAPHSHVSQARAREGTFDGGLGI